MEWHFIQKHCQYVYCAESLFLRYRSWRRLCWSDRFTSQFAIWDSRLGTTSIWLLGCPVTICICTSHLTMFVRPGTTLQITHSANQHLTTVKAVKINWHHSNSTSRAPERIAIHWWCACSVSRFYDKTRHLIWAWWHISIYNQSQYLRGWKRIINLGPAWVGYILRPCFGKLETSPVTYFMNCIDNSNLSARSILLWVCEIYKLYRNCTEKSV